MSTVQCNSNLEKLSIVPNVCLCCSHFKHSKISSLHCWLRIRLLIPGEARWWRSRKAVTSAFVTYQKKKWYGRTSRVWRKFVMDTDYFSKTTMCMRDTDVAAGIPPLRNDFCECRLGFEFSFIWSSNGQQAGVSQASHFLQETAVYFVSHFLVCSSELEVIFEHCLNSPSQWQSLGMQYPGLS